MNSSSWSLVVFMFLADGLFFSGPVNAGFLSDSTHPRQGRAKDTMIVWGVNGHPIAQAAYFGNIDLQMRLIKESGLSYYRVDMPHNETGIIGSGESLERFETLTKKAAGNQITLIPVLFPPDSARLYGLPDVAEAYAIGLTQGKEFATRYGQLFTYYELGNENDLHVLKNPPTDGHDTAQYEPARYRLLAGWLKGMIAGIRGIDQDAKFIVSNSGWNRYAYFDVLRSEGVKYDILGYHWYDGVPRLRRLLKKLTTSYAGQTVWFTEVNRRGGSSTGFNRQKRDVIKELRLIRDAGKNIRGAFIYELFDEPYYSSVEGSYGIFGWQHYPDTTRPKPIAVKLRGLSKK